VTDLFGAGLINAISLWQPWASLCFVIDPELRKLDETRHWQYPPRLAGERIAIHAAAKFPSQLDEDLIAVCEAAFGINFWRTLPASAVIGTVRLGDCRPASTVRDATTPANRSAGDFSDFTIVKGVQRRRYAWALHDPRALTEPLPMKGKQGWRKIAADLLTKDTSL
jgi:hypothetical protein